jgi:electron transfer flavoprotein alpha subunit
MTRTPTTVRHVTLQTPARPAFEVIGCSEAEHNAPVDGAGIVVSGGRGIGDPAGFELLYEIAQQLGGAVGASLPAVDAGLAPVARQVGQSGKYVRPDIYLAVGISGTPQHMAGIDPHTRVVAVNADPEAPIFGMSRVGVVGEWQEILPALKRKLSE